MGQKSSQQLLSLSSIDGKINSLTEKQHELESRRHEFVTLITERRGRLAAYEKAHKEGTLKQVMEEHRLRDEHERIVERRRQLSSIGGAKVAKMMEREIDIASRSLQAMEERAMKALEEVDEMETHLGELRTSLEEVESQFENENQEIEKELTAVLGELKTLNKEREEVAGTLDDRLSRLYNRVRSRYPGDPVAVAESGACRSCFRSLPQQTYNQVLAGNLYIQCPGCSRLLVTVQQ